MFVCCPRVFFQSEVLLLPTSITPLPSQPSSGVSLCTLSSRAFCHSLNIIMYVLSRAPKEVKKCWMGREGEKNQFRKKPKNRGRTQQACLGSLPIHTAQIEAHGEASAPETALLEMCCWKTWMGNLAPHLSSRLSPGQHNLCPQPFSLGFSIVWKNPTPHSNCPAPSSHTEMS